MNHNDKQCTNKYCKVAVEVLKQIKEKFRTELSRDEKIQLLTLAPKFWGRSKLMLEFGTSEREARNAFKFVSEHEIFSLPKPRSGTRKI